MELELGTEWGRSVAFELFITHPYHRHRRRRPHCVSSNCNVSFIGKQQIPPKYIHSPTWDRFQG